jgi:hypothetical protein
VGHLAADFNFATLVIAMDAISSKKGAGHLSLNFTGFRETHLHGFKE